MIPADALNKISRVTIHYYTSEYICGFSFFDKDGALLYKIGKTWSDLKKETVVLAENEVIVGVVAKLYQGDQSAYTYCIQGDQSAYTDFQFVIAERLD